MNGKYEFDIQDFKVKLNQLRTEKELSQKKCPKEFI